jgi:hypothetical protein
MIERDWRSTWRRSIWREARRQLDCRSWDDAVLGVCCTRC